MRQGASHSLTGKEISAVLTQEHSIRLINDVYSDFDETIGQMLEFANENKETLIIVTADHETGCVAINPKSKQKRVKLGFTSKDHTCTLVPVYAYGPGAEYFSGIYDNTAINRKI